ncbi:MAG: hypothetical protein MUO31_00930 [Thermodesulfovibrionales bacterium]|nr:hypothetical protein [Thermodesulfovibrionales bacterium]
MSISDDLTIFDIQPFPLMPRFKQVSLDVIKFIMLLPYPRNFDIYCVFCGITLKPWQRQECLNMIEKDEYLLNWGRGMSKTILMSLVTVFDALCALKTCYIVPRTDELVQPIEYFNANPFVDLNPYKKYGDKVIWIEKARWFRVMGRSMIKITNMDDKGYNVSSGRFSRIKYDECALLMYYAKEVELLNKGDGMLRAMPYPRKSWSSTPLIGSHFVTMMEDKKEHFPEEYSWRNFENTPDNFLTNTPDKLRIIERERENARRMGILYAWETENLAIPQTASGAAFKNYIAEDFQTFVVQNHSRIGFDFHGYRYGHIWVALGFNSAQYESDVWVIAEGQEKYEENANADESMLFLTEPYFDCELYGEGDTENMINGPFLKAGQTWGMEPVNIMGQEKYNLEANMLNFTWHVDRKKTPNFYIDFTEAEWADQNKFSLHKEASGRKFRNHYIDAAMVALPKARGRNIYIPNRRLNIQSFIEQDRKAHATRRY